MTGRANVSKRDMVEAIALGTPWRSVAEITGYNDEQAARKGAKRMGLRRVANREVPIITDSRAGFIVNVVHHQRTA